MEIVKFANAAVMLVVHFLYFRISDTKIKSTGIGV